MKKNWGKTKKGLLSLISAVAFFAVIWALFYGKIKAQTLLAPLINKLPKDESGLTRFTENILGSAIEKIDKESIKKATEKGSEFIENSQYGEPVRDIRENIIKKLEEVVVSTKELPAKEVEIIKREICTQWFGDEFVATPGAQR